MDWQEYEEVVSRIGKSIYGVVEAVSKPEVKWGHRNKWSGASGYLHQIDVSVCHNKCLYLVECKHWGKNIPAEKVLAFYARWVDIREFFDGQVYAIMATSTGWQPAADTIAKHFKIQLWLVRSPAEFAIRFKGRFFIAKQDTVVVAENVSVKVVDCDGT